MRGRGTPHNPPNRFTRVQSRPDPALDDLQYLEPEPLPETEFIPDHSKSVLSHNDSPDIGFDESLNPYRGCEHGCIYCYARPMHEYLGFSAGLDFERKILVKENAPELLRRELLKDSWTPQPIALSGATDCYQPIERKLRITRRCLQVLAEFRNPVTLTTKNRLVLRDMDILKELARFEAVRVQLSISTLDAELARVLEPRTSPPAERLRTVAALNEAGVPTGVLVAPVIPGLSDEWVARVVDAAGGAGARFVEYLLLRLPHGLPELFSQWLEEHFPERKNKVLRRLEAMRGGCLNENRYFLRFGGEGVFADQIAQVFELARKRAGIPERGPRLSTEHFRRPLPGQLTLWA
ncbi:PA0069 family radical SAM protein [bacterium]|nr:PA0069 family radical SAM protein [bacterium]